MEPLFSQLPESQQTIVQVIKSQRSVTLDQLAKELSVSKEAIRQHMIQLRNNGWVRRRPKGGAAAQVGRPIHSYELTLAGEHLFPKNYDLLALELIGIVQATGDSAALEKVVSIMSDKRVNAWEGKFKDKTFEEKVQLLQNIYSEDDPFMEVSTEGDKVRLIEKNCPFMNVAAEHPGICSLTVSVMTRLLGVEVVRNERFQLGDRRCVFEIHRDRPVSDKNFHPEPAAPERNPVPSPHKA